jgi:hypothetical protein
MTFSFLSQYPADLFLKWEMFQIKIVEKSKPRFIFRNFLRKSCRLGDNVEKYYKTREAADDMAHARCILAN